MHLHKVDIDCESEGKWLNGFGCLLQIKSEIVVCICIEPPFVDAPK